MLEQFQELALGLEIGVLLGSLIQCIFLISIMLFYIYNLQARLPGILTNFVH